MYVKVKTIDGQRDTLLNVSKLTKVYKLKKEIKGEFGIEERLQLLFFRGKQLEDDCTLHDYSVNINDVIQVMIKSEVKDSPIEPENENKKTKKAAAVEEDEEVEAESLRFKVGDSVDCLDSGLGAWFEAVIVKIFTTAGKLLYKMRWDLADADENDRFSVPENFIRLRAWQKLKPSELKVGLRVMLNHNLENSNSTGQWYDYTISKVVNSKQLVGTLHIGSDSRTVQDLQVNVKDDVYAIEKSLLLEERNEEEMLAHIPKGRRKIPVKCTSCNDNPRKKCKDCSCATCGGKQNPDVIVLCDECDSGFHIQCLDPPLSEIPDTDHWYCPDCKVDENEIIKAGEKFVKKKNLKAVGSGKQWGGGMACIGRTKKCTIVSQHHRGPIPGVDVGTCWMYRIQASEAGVHRPHVAGIHGRASDCAYSLVLSGGYEDDIDNGDEFLYTGSGGRDLSGNKRTVKRQTRDQTLRLMNKALALNCNAKVDSDKGATSKDWKAGIPIRVIRNYKLGQHSRYAPTEGNRYDGIYKIVKYWPEVGRSGYRIWRYMLRRDDPTPAPWTEEGRKRIAKLGLTTLYPENYREAQEKKAAAGKKRKVPEDESSSPTVASPSIKRRKTLSFEFSSDLSNLIQQDRANAKLWSDCTNAVSEGKTAFMDKVSNEFACVVCQDLVLEPITTPCLHNICQMCLKRSFSAEAYSCPMCRQPLEKNEKMLVNRALSSVLLQLFPGYTNGR